MRRALIVFAKTPRPGCVKTRLADLTDADRLRLHLAFLADVLAVAGSVPAVTRFLYFSDAEGPAECRRHGLALPQGWQIRVQAGEDLGGRLAHAFGAQFDDGFDAVAIVGSDHPLLSEGQIVTAFDHLQRNDAVLGPTPDGGYYLVGLRAPVPELFGGIAWSTDEVLAASLERLRAAGRSYALLEPGSDVDTMADLKILESELAGAPPERAAHTRRALAQGRWRR